MTDASTLARPRWTLIAAILLLIWNLTGIAAFAGQWLMADDQFAQLPPAQRELWTAMPAWAWAAYGIAVVSGTLGALGLLLKRRWAVAAFALCMIAVIVQFSYPFLVSDIGRREGMAMAAFPLFITVVSLAQLLLARRWMRWGWLR